jgi:hypothetical protein
MDADHVVVPLAVPDPPVLVDQVIFATPTLSLAVPLNAIEDADVDTLVAPGDPIVNVGGVVSGPAGVVGAACLVMVTTCDTFVVPAVANTVMVFTPIARAIFDMVQAEALPAALPEIATEEDAVDHVTEIAPEPPCAVADRVTVAAVVVDAVAFTVSVNAEGEGEGDGDGAGAGAGAGAGDAPCAAYMV